MILYDLSFKNKMVFLLEVFYFKILFLLMYLSGSYILYVRYMVNLIHELTAASVAKFIDACGCCYFANL